MGESTYIDQLKSRLDKAEALVISLGTANPGKKSRTDEQEHKDDGSDHGSSSSDDEDEDGGEDEDEREQSDHSSSSSDDGQGGAGGQPGADQNMETSPDLGAPRTDPKKTDKGIDAAPAPTKLLTLSSLSNKKGDSDNKRTRSSAEQLSDKEQRSNKRPPSAMSVTINTAQNMMLAACEHSTAEARSDAIRNAVHYTTSAGIARNQEKEEAIQEEVRNSAQNVRWVRGPVPANVDHWFYDPRNAGTEPSASLIAASRKMVLKWKAALGRGYFPLSESAGGSALRVEYAHRSFKAVTVNMPLSGWTSRACAKHQIMHDMMSIPKLVAKDGNPPNTRPCPLIYYYEQLLEDMRHIVTHRFETIHRTILNPIPKPTISSPPRHSRTAPPNSSSSSTPDRYAWRQPKSVKGKRTHLLPMNISKNWPRTYTRATRAFPTPMNMKIRNSTTGPLTHC